MSKSSWLRFSVLTAFPTSCDSVDKQVFWQSSLEFFYQLLFLIFIFHWLPLRLLFNLLAKFSDTNSLGDFYNLLSISDEMLFSPRCSKTGQTVSLPPPMFHRWNKPLVLDNKAFLVSTHKYSFKQKMFVLFHLADVIFSKLKPVSLSKSFFRFYPDFHLTWNSSACSSVIFAGRPLLGWITHPGIYSICCREMYFFSWSFQS